MGTSKGFPGPPSGLVPSWADDPPAGEAPASTPAGGDQAPGPAAPGDGKSAPGEDGMNSNNPPPAANAPTPPRPLRQARARFTSFAKTGSSSALGAAVSRHVASVGGPAGAARRMGASRIAAGNLLGVVRDVQRYGLADALRARGLEQLIGRPAEDVYLGLLDTICLPGGPIDEAISRQALLDAIQDRVDAGLGSFDNLDADQLKELFLDYVIRSIEGKVISDIAARGISVPEDAGRAIQMEEQLRDFIAGATRTHVGELLDRPLTAYTDPQVNDIAGRIYEQSFAFLQVAGEAAQ